MQKSGYMAFMSEAPIVGLDPHPGYAPQDVVSTNDVEGWFRAYNCETDRTVLEAEITDSHEAQVQAVKDGDLEDTDEPDFILPVTVHDDGQLDVHDETGQHLIVSYTTSEVYGAFGMKIPTFK